MSEFEKDAAISIVETLNREAKGYFMLIVAGDSILFYGGFIQYVVPIMDAGDWCFNLVPYHIQRECIHILIHRLFE